MTSLISDIIFDHPLFIQLRDLESEFEAEQRRSREFVTVNRKIERQLQEFRLTYEEEHRTNQELSDTCNTLSIRVNTLRRQLEEAVG